MSRVQPEHPAFKRIINDSVLPLPPVVSVYISSLFPERVATREREFITERKSCYQNELMNVEVLV